jgi:hypothetical protein
MEAIIPHRRRRFDDQYWLHTAPVKGISEALRLTRGLTRHGIQAVSGAVKLSHIIHATDCIYDLSIIYRIVEHGRICLFLALFKCARSIKGNLPLFVFSYNIRINEQ